MDTAEPIPTPTPTPTPSPEDLARARAQACSAELQAVLRRHRCRIAPQLTAEPIGTDGGRAILAAAYAIVPEFP